jgi:hypothetical protein
MMGLDREGISLIRVIRCGLRGGGEKKNAYSHLECQPLYGSFDPMGDAPESELYDGRDI